MNTKSIIIVGLCLLVISLVFWSFAPNKISESKRTEEYAHIKVEMLKNKQNIHISKGLADTITIEIVNEKVSSWNDVSPVLKIINKLNGEGFEMVNSNIAYEALDGNAPPIYYFLMVRKIKYPNFLTIKK